jgi:ABC-type glutathione transport system ATPase component
LADRIGVLIDGELLQEGMPDEVFSRPSCPGVAELVSAASELAAWRIG